MKFAIIGLGYFGSALAHELAASGHEVLAIDTNENHIREIKDVVAMAAQADGTDAEALAQLGVGDMDTAVVAIGEGFEASLMITAHCQDLGVQRVYTRVINDVHEHLLGLMKITGKIRAESLAAGYFSRQLTNDAVHRYFGIDADHGIVEIEMPAALDGQTLAEADLRHRFGLNVVTVRRPVAVDPRSSGSEAAYTVMGTPDPTFKLQKHDHLVVFGRLKEIDRFSDQQ